MLTYSAQAHWVSLDTILWNYDSVMVYPDHREFRLYFDPSCSMRIEAQPNSNGHTNGHNNNNNCNGNGFYTSHQRKSQNQKQTLLGGEFVKLVLAKDGPSPDLIKKFPHLSRFGALKLPEDFKPEGVSMMLKCQLMITLWDNDNLIRYTGLQIPGVLDCLYGHYDGALGVCFGDDAQDEVHSIAPTLRVWAPTARKVAVRLYDQPPNKNEDTSTDPKMEIDENDKKKIEKGIPVLPYRRGSLANVYYAIQKDDDNDNEPFERVVMVEDVKTGVWSVQGEVSWLGKYYLYEIEVFVPRAGRLSHHLATDPYSISLSADGHRSQIVDIRRDPETMPSNWLSSITSVDLPLWAKNNYNTPVDAVIYEMHIRDFSSSDASVPDQLKGTYLAFADEWLPSDFEGSAIDRDLSKAGNTNGMKHLKSLAESGLTHVHLLPAFDFASVDERGASEIRKGGKRNMKIANLFNSGGSLKENMSRASKKPQGMIRLMNQQGLNPYNWGYDPVHWLAPEGSYATVPDGATRISQFRRMVAGLHRTGLRVVMDVVFNHMADQSERRQTFKQSKKGLNPVAEEHFGSILERIVPGYYHRLDLNGKIERSACGLNTASENAMMRKLMVDALKMWAVQYRVDGFRFDLMGHHMKHDIEKVKETLSSLTLEKDGVDGSKILIYGEGWDFGEVACNSRGINATQTNLVGTGIGTFNDRLRDAVRGGSAFGPVRAQGFATGLLCEPNQVPNDEDEDEECSKPEEESEQKMKYYCEIISLGMAGNLSSFPLMIGDSGKQMHGNEIQYHGQAAGYCAQPSENVVYVSAHDNETLFDAIQIKAHPTSATIEDRVRMHCLSNAIVMMSHGIAFFQAGDDILRSKSLDRNSYNAGDWFNTIDFSYDNCGWGKGLPLLEDNGERWDFLKPLLMNAALAPHREHIVKSHEIFKEFLRIRRDCSLFRLPNEEEINKRVRFYNLGRTYTKPGLIVMSIDGSNWKDSNDFARVVVLLNADKQTVNYSIGDYKGLNFELHPVQQASVDEVVRKSTFDESKGEFEIPGRTAAVFVQKRVDVYFV